MIHALLFGYRNSVDRALPAACADVFADLFPAAPAVPSDGLPLAAGGLVDTVTGPVQAALDAANRGDVARTAGSTRRRSDHRWIRA
jgi:hypothetical protein